MVIYLYFLYPCIVYRACVQTHSSEPLFYWYFMHATYHRIIAKSSKYVGDVDEGIRKPRNMALRVMLRGVIL